MPVTTVSSRELNQDISAAKRAAGKGPVFITDRGEPVFVLLSYDEYRRVIRSGPNILDLVAMPGDDICEDFDLELPRSRELPRAADLS